MQQRNTNGPDDLTLIKRILAGEKKLFPQLVNRYAPLAHHFFYNRVGRNLETTHDLMQEAFTKVFLHLPSFRLDSSFKAWFMAICRNMAINQFNRRKLEESFAQANPPETEKADFSHDLVNKELVRKAIAVLPEVQREVVEMKYFWDLSCKEISDILAVPEGSIKSHLFHARARMLEVLGENEV